MLFNLPIGSHSYNVTSPLELKMAWRSRRKRRTTTRCFRSFLAATAAVHHCTATESAVKQIRTITKASAASAASHDYTTTTLNHQRNHCQPKNWEKKLFGLFAFSNRPDWLRIETKLWTWVGLSVAHCTVHARAHSNWKCTIEVARGKSLG